MSLLLLLKIFLAGGMLATIYKIYLHIIETVDTVENKIQDKKIAADSAKITGDANEVTKADADLKSALDKLKSDG